MILNKKENDFADHAPGLGHSLPISALPTPAAAAATHNNSNNQSGSHANQINAHKQTHPPMDADPTLGGSGLFVRWPVCLRRPLYICQSALC